MRRTRGSHEGLMYQTLYIESFPLRLVFFIQSWFSFCFSLHFHPLLNLLLCLPLFLFDLFLITMKEIVGNPLHLKSLNHISLICRSVEQSIDFYQNVLGFVPIRRPGSFDFDGAWLFGYGIGIHLLQSEEPENMPKKTEINPKDSHISFQCESMGAVEKKLKEMELNYKRAMVEEGGIRVDQLFFHDPDGFMIEICDCDNIPVIPLAGEMARSCSLVNLPILQHQQQQIRVTQQ